MPLPMPTLGLLMLQTRFPRPLGDIGHSGTFAFAVRQRVVHGATPAAVVRGCDAALLQPFIEAGRLQRAFCAAGLAQRQHVRAQAH